jgi:hypothetical protein
VLGNVIVQGMTNSNSIYNAASVLLQRRFSGGVGFRFNYTWGKSMDNSSSAMAAYFIQY